MPMITGIVSTGGASCCSCSVVVAPTRTVVAVVAVVVVVVVVAAVGPPLAILPICDGIGAVLASPVPALVAGVGDSGVGGDVGGGVHTDVPQSRFMQLLTYGLSMFAHAGSGHIATHGMKSSMHVHVF
jgi:hypothetical protein